MALGLSPLGLTPLGLTVEQESDGGVTANASITEGSDTASASVAVPLAATATAEETGDSVAGTSAVPTDATASITETEDSADSVSHVEVAASAVGNEDQDTVNAVASVDSDEVLASAAFTELGDSVEGVADVLVVSTGTVNESMDSVAGAGIAEVDPRYARPRADIDTGSWTSSTGGSLASVLDDSSPDSTDYIETSAPGSCEIALGAVQDPGVHTGHKFKYQVWSPHGNSLLMQLRQGATVIASWLHDPLPTTPTVFEHLLTVEQAASITNYADLRLHPEAL